MKTVPTPPPTDQTNWSTGCVPGGPPPAPLKGSWWPHRTTAFHSLRFTSDRIVKERHRRHNRPGPSSEEVEVRSDRGSFTVRFTNWSPSASQVAASEAVLPAGAAADQDMDALAVKQPSSAWMKWLGRHRLLGLFSISQDEAMNQNTFQRRILDDPVLRHQPLRLGALPCSGRPEQDQPHRRLPRSLDFLISPSY